MPRFFFEARDGARHGPDDEGLEFYDRAAAEFEAGQATTAILQDRSSGGPSGEVTITLADAEGNDLSSVTATLTIKRARP